ncbi:GroES-like protein [Ganoderma leucocontextum]|nr:GroES-like protein [Ganoderma leucocontextum]
MAPPSQRALILPAKRGNFVVGLAVIPRPGPSEVLVRIESAALNPVEWKIQTYGEVGSEVTTLVKGDRMQVFWQGFFEPQHGTYQQYSVVPAELAAKIPSTVPFDEVSALPVAICMAVLGMYNHNPASKSAHFIPPWEKDGPTVNARKPALIMGGASSVGQACALVSIHPNTVVPPSLSCMIAIQMAKLSGFSPIVTTASPHKSSLLTTLGADHVLDRNIAQPELLSQIATAMAGVPLTFAYDAISSPETQRIAFNALAPGGTLIITRKKAISTLEEQANESKTIVEVFASVYVSDNREIGVALFKQLPGWLESGVLQPNKAEVIPDGLAGITTGLCRAYQDWWSQRDQVGRSSS